MRILIAMEKIFVLLATLQLTHLEYPAALTALNTTSSTCTVISASRALVMSAVVTGYSVVLRSPKETARLIAHPRDKSLSAPNTTSSTATSAPQALVMSAVPTGHGVVFHSPKETAGLTHPRHEFLTATGGGVVLTSTKKTSRLTAHSKDKFLSATGGGVVLTSTKKTSSLTAHPKDNSPKGVYKISSVKPLCSQICPEEKKPEKIDDDSPSGSHGWTIVVAISSFVILMPQWLKWECLCIFCTLVLCGLKWIRDKIWPN